MFHNRTMNNKINRLHERALRIVYKNDSLTFQELLDLDNSVSIHHKNIQKVAIEMYKVKNNLSLPLINNLFKFNSSNYNLRGKRTWDIPEVRTVSHGMETIRYRGPLIWEMLPSFIKDSKNVITFKNNIRNWKATECKCRLCKIFIPNLGYL